MKLTIESTDKLTVMDGIPVCVWNGVTKAGVKCLVFVHRLAVHNDEDQSQFDRELVEQLPPGIVVPLREVY